MGLRSFDLGFSRFQARARELAQDAAGADLHECAHTRGVQSVDLFHEAHRLRDLCSEPFAHAIGIRWVGCAIGIRIHGECRLAELGFA